MTVTTKEPKRRGSGVFQWPPRVSDRGIEEHAPPPDIAARESVFRRLLAAADLLSAALALVVAVQVLGDDTLRWPALLVLPLVVAVAKVSGLYDRDALLINKTTLDEVPKLFQSAALYTLTLTVADTYFVTGDLGGRQTLGILLVLVAASVAGRWLARRLARRMVGPERVLVIGSPVESARLMDKLDRNPGVNAEVVGCVPLGGEKLVAGEVGVADLHRLVADLGVHRVLIAPGAASSERMLDAIRAAKAVGVQVSVLPRLLEVVGSSVEFDQLYGMSVLGVRRFGLTTSSQAVKRALDVVGAAAGLLLMAPACAVITVFVRATSPGPVFFRQHRVGKDGVPFAMVKFRTMVDGAEGLQAGLEPHNEADGGLFKIADDPRVTRAGRVLRRASLDELPQLVNVLKGEMSLVGPRPLVPMEDSRIEGQHRRRLHLKPGMTGQWQIDGSSKVPLQEMVTIDYLYVANWSLWGDVKILLRTLPHVLARRGL